MHSRLRFAAVLTLTPSQMPAPSPSPPLIPARCTLHLRVQRCAGLRPWGASHLGTDATVDAFVVARVHAALPELHTLSSAPPVTDSYAVTHRCRSIDPCFSHDCALPLAHASDWLSIAVCDAAAAAPSGGGRRIVGAVAIPLADVMDGAGVVDRWFDLQLPIIPPASTSSLSHSSSAALARWCPEVKPEDAILQVAATGGPYDSAAELHGASSPSSGGVDGASSGVDPPQDRVSAPVGRIRLQMFSTSHDAAPSARPSRGLDRQRPSSQAFPEEARTLTLHVISWNVGNAPLPGDLRALMPPATAAPAPDLVAIGLQECSFTPAERDMSGDPLSTAGSGVGGPTSSSAACDASVTGSFTRLLGAAYTRIRAHSFGEMKLLLFVRSALRHEVSALTFDTVPLGIGGVLSNKGIIVASLCVRHTRLAFVTGHLAAHTSKLAQRNHDLERAVKGVDFAFPSSDDSAATTTAPPPTTFTDVLASFHHVFLFGDLNYRIAHPSDPLANSPSPRHFAQVVQLVRGAAWDTLRAWDQLLAEQAAGRALVGFSEGALDFPPTFKVIRGVGLGYTAKRTPSWCDRILWRSVFDTPPPPRSPSSSSEDGSHPPAAAGDEDVASVRQTSLRPVISITSSDHKALVSSFALGVWWNAGATDHARPGGAAGGAEILFEAMQVSREQGGPAIGSGADATNQLAQALQVAPSVLAAGAAGGLLLELRAPFLAEPLLLPLSGGDLVQQQQQAAAPTLLPTPLRRGWNNPARIVRELVLLRVFKAGTARGPVAAGAVPLARGVAVLRPDAAHAPITTAATAAALNASPHTEDRFVLAAPLLRLGGTLACHFAARVTLRFTTTTKERAKRRNVPQVARGMAQGSSEDDASRQQISSPTSTISTSKRGSAILAAALAATNDDEDDEDDEQDAYEDDFILPSPAPAPSPSSSSSSTTVARGSTGSASTTQRLHLSVHHRSTLVSQQHGLVGSSGGNGSSGSGSGSNSRATPSPSAFKDAYQSLGATGSSLVQSLRREHTSLHSSPPTVSTASSSAARRGPEEDAEGTVAAVIITASPSTTRSLTMLVALLASSEECYARGLERLRREYHDPLWMQARAREAERTPSSSASAQQPRSERKDSVREGSSSSINRISSVHRVASFSSQAVSTLRSSMVRAPPTASSSVRTPSLYDTMPDPAAPGSEPQGFSASEFVRRPTELLVRVFGNVPSLAPLHAALFCEMEARLRLMHFGGVPRRGAGPSAASATPSRAPAAPASASSSSSSSTWSRTTPFPSQALLSLGQLLRQFMPLFSLYRFGRAGGLEALESRGTGKTPQAEGFAQSIRAYITRVDQDTSASASASSSSSLSCAALLALVPQRVGSYAYWCTEVLRLLRRVPPAPVQAQARVRDLVDLYEQLVRGFEQLRSQAAYFQGEWYDSLARARQQREEADLYARLAGESEVDVHAHVNSDDDDDADAGGYPSSSTPPLPLQYRPSTPPRPSTAAVLRPNHTGHGYGGAAGSLEQSYLFASGRGGHGNDSFRPATSYGHFDDDDDNDDAVAGTSVSEAPRRSEGDAADASIPSTQLHLLPQLVLTQLRSRHSTLRGFHAYEPRAETREDESVHFHRAAAHSTWSEQRAAGWPTRARALSADDLDLFKIYCLTTHSSEHRRRVGEEEHEHLLLFSGASTLSRSARLSPSAAAASSAPSAQSSEWSVDRLADLIGAPRSASKARGGGGVGMGGTLSRSGSHWASSPSSGLPASLRQLAAGRAMIALLDARATLLAEASSAHAPSATPTPRSLRSPTGGPSSFDSPRSSRPSTAAFSMDPEHEASLFEDELAASADQATEGEYEAHDMLLSMDTEAFQRVLHAAAKVKSRAAAAPAATSAAGTGAGALPVSRSKTVSAAATASPATRSTVAPARPSLTSLSHSAAPAAGPSPSPSARFPAPPLRVAAPSARAGSSTSTAPAHTATSAAVGARPATPTRPPSAGSTSAGSRVGAVGSGTPSRPESAHRAVAVNSNAAAHRSAAPHAAAAAVAGASHARVPAPATAHHPGSSLLVHRAASSPLMLGVGAAAAAATLSAPQPGSELQPALVLRPRRASQTSTTTTPGVRRPL